MEGEDTRYRHFGKKMAIMSRFGDVWIGCTYIDSSDSSGSCSDEAPFLCATRAFFASVFIVCVCRVFSELMDR